MMVPAMYWSASEGEIHDENRCRKKSQARNAIEKGFTTQLTKRVISNPFGFLPTFRTEAKSTLIIMGMIMSQIRMAMGTLIWLSAPNSRLLKDCTTLGAHFPNACLLYTSPSP